LRNQWNEVYAGSANAGKVVILEEGMTFAGVSMTNTDAQMLASEQWQVADVARWFRMPLIMIQEYANSTNWGTGIEQTQIGFVVFTMLPWFIRWERRVNKELIAPLGGDYFAEFTMENLLRGDVRTRFEAYQIAAGGNAPWMHRNEIRKRENLNAWPERARRVPTADEHGTGRRAATRNHVAPSGAGRLRDRPSCRRRTREREVTPRCWRRSW
jgi:HK97 family phage portal protein